MTARGSARIHVYILLHLLHTNGCMIRLGSERKGEGGSATESDI